MFELLVRASIGGAVVAAVVWLLCRLLPRLSPSTRALLWWCAAAKFLIALAWVAPVEVPVMPAAVSPLTARSASAPYHVGDRYQSAPAGDHHPGRAVSPKPPSSSAPDPNAPRGDTTKAIYRETIVIAWAIGVGVAVAIAIRRWRRMRAIVRQSGPAPWRTQALAEELSVRLGLSQAPDVLVSNQVATPLVAGLRHPVVVLPGERFSRLSSEKQRMAICHELAHVRRRDLALGCVPALAERLFFFHPLAILAAREYALWREAACDEVVLNALDAAPNDYGRLLLDLGITRPGVGLAAAGASWSFPNLKRRLVMLGRRSTPSAASRFLSAAALAVSFAALLPLQLVGREPGSAAPVIATSAHEAPAPVQLPTPGRTAKILSAPVVVEGEPQAGAAAAPPAKADASDRNDLNFTLFVDDNNIMHGSSRDYERARRFRRGAEPMVWFRHDGKEYVIRDRNVIAQIQAMWKPIGELGAEQGKLGAQQGALGAKQGEYGAKQGALGAKQGELGSRMGQLGAKQAELAGREARELTDAERRDLERAHAELDLEMEKLSKEMDKLGEEMKSLGRPMEELGKQMEPLGKEMEVLGRKMEEASRQAEAQMRSLLERTIKDGTAEAVE